MSRPEWHMLRIQYSPMSSTEIPLGPGAVRRDRPGRCCVTDVSGNSS